MTLYDRRKPVPPRTSFEDYCREVERDNERSKRILQHQPPVLTGKALVKGLAWSVFWGVVGWMFVWLWLAR